MTNYRSRVKLHADERVDLPDLSGMASSVAEEYLAALVKNLIGGVGKIVGGFNVTKLTASSVRVTQTGSVGGAVIQADGTPITEGQAATADITGITGIGSPAGVIEVRAVMTDDATSLDTRKFIDNISLTEYDDTVVTRERADWEVQYSTTPTAGWVTLAEIYNPTGANIEVRQTRNHWAEPVLSTDSLEQLVGPISYVSSAAGYTLVRTPLVPGTDQGPFCDEGDLTGATFDINQHHTVALVEKVGPSYFVRAVLRVVGVDTAGATWNYVLSPRFDGTLLGGGAYYLMFRDNWNSGISTLYTMLQQMMMAIWEIKSITPKSGIGVATAEARSSAVGRGALERPEISLSHLASTHYGELIDLAIGIPTLVGAHRPLTIFDYAAKCAGWPIAAASTLYPSDISSPTAVAQTVNEYFFHDLTGGKSGFVRTRGLTYNGTNFLALSDAGGTGTAFSVWAGGATTIIRHYRSLTSGATVDPFGADTATTTSVRIDATTGEVSIYDATHYTAGISLAAALKLAVNCTSTGMGWTGNHYIDGLTVKAAAETIDDQLWARPNFDLVSSTYQVERITTAVNAGDIGPVLNSISGTKRILIESGVYTSSVDINLGWNTALAVPRSNVTLYLLGDVVIDLSGHFFGSSGSGVRVDRSGFSGAPRYQIVRTSGSELIVLQNDSGVGVNWPAGYVAGGGKIWLNGRWITPIAQAFTSLELALLTDRSLVGGAGTASINYMAITPGLNIRICGPGRLLLKNGPLYLKQVGDFFAQCPIRVTSVTDYGGLNFGFYASLCANLRIDDLQISRVSQTLAQDMFVYGAWLSSVLSVHLPNLKIEEIYNDPGVVKYSSGLYMEDVFQADIVAKIDGLESAGSAPYGVVVNGPGGAGAAAWGTRKVYLRGSVDYMTAGGTKLLDNSTPGENDLSVL